MRKGARSRVLRPATVPGEDRNALTLNGQTTAADVVRRVRRNFRPAPQKDVVYGRSGMSSNGWNRLAIVLACSLPGLVISMV
ncbi:hypothetical protein JD81_05902 [Micromonospora sagamiensis]|uniref:Uncharacterized protein n=1 Tax=Micromonospora sagamiensis TaxID=47875 RepID=A0A562WR81_9ACTN|nr:hypothetical protein JD81_05902 [Micromonospora sagamiensis]